jgi:hypothetical protein
MFRRTEWRERYTDQTSLVKSVQVDLGSFMSIQDYFESLASIGMARSAKISCGPFVSKARSWKANIKLTIQNRDGFGRSGPWSTGGA